MFKAPKGPKEHMISIRYGSWLDVPDVHCQSPWWTAAESVALLKQNMLGFLELLRTTASSIVEGNSEIRKLWVYELML